MGLKMGIPGLSTICREIKQGRKMNQPKFKFGEQVVSLCTNKLFTIDKIVCVENEGFVYFGKDYHEWGCNETVLKLYQEPQKKKVLFYKEPSSGRLQAYTDGETSPFGCELFGEIELGETK